MREIDGEIDALIGRAVPLGQSACPSVKDILVVFLCALRVEQVSVACHQHLAIHHNALFSALQHQIRFVIFTGFQQFLRLRYRLTGLVKRHQILVLNHANTGQTQGIDSPFRSPFASFSLADWIALFSGVAHSLQTGR